MPHSSHLVFRGDGLLVTDGEYVREKLCTIQNSEKRELELVVLSTYTPMYLGLEQNVPVYSIIDSLI